MRAFRDMIGPLARGRAGHSQIGNWSAALDAAGDGLLVIDAARPAAVIVYANAAFATLSGRAAADLLGADPLLFFDAASHDSLRQLLALALHEDQPQRAIVPMISATGAPRWLSLIVRPLGLLGPSGQLVVTLVEITAEQASQQRTSGHQPSYRALAANAQDLVIVVDANAKIIFVAGNFLTLHGITAEDRVGRSALEFVHPDDLSMVAARLTALARTPGAREALEYRVHRADGAVRWFSSIGVNLLHEPDVRGIVINTRDVTERKRAEAELERARDHLDIAVRGARIALWENDADSDANSWLNDEWYHYLGVDPVIGRQTVDYGCDGLHPDDVEGYRRARLAHLGGKTPEFKHAYRMRTQDGSYKWLLDCGRVTSRAPDGRALKMSGMTLDIDALKRAESALRDSESRLEVTLWGAEVGLFDWRAWNDRLTWIDDWCERCNLDPCDGVDHERRWTAQMHPDDLPAYQSRLDSHYAGATHQFDVEYRIRDRQGAWVWIQERGRVIERDAAGRALRMVGLCFNIEERRRAAAALRSSEQRFDLAIWGSQVGFWDWNLETEDTRWISDWCRTLDLDPCDGPNHVRRWDERIHADDLVAAQASFSAALSGAHDFYEGEYRVLTLGGRWRWILERGRVVSRAPNGRALRMAGICMDIDIRKRAEEALRRAEARLDTALWSARVAYWDWDLTARAVHLSNHWFAMSGYVRAQWELDRESWRQRVHPDDLPRAEAAANAHIEGRTPLYEVEYRIRVASGEWKWLLDRGRIVESDALGAPLKISGTSTDIDERKRAERELEQSEYRYRTVAALSPGFVQELAPVGDSGLRIQWASDGFEQLFGVKVSQLDPQGGWRDRCHPEDRAALEDRRRAVLRGERTEAEIRVLDRHGETRWLHSVTQPVIDPATGRMALAIGMCSDITTRKNAELALQKSESTLRAVAYNVSDWLLLADLELTCRFVNRDLLGRVPQQWIGSSVLELATFPDRAQLARVLGQAIASSTSTRLEFQVTGEPDPRHFEVRAAPVTEQGAVAGLTLAVTEITQRKLAEATLRTQATVLETMREGVAVIGGDGRVRLTNPAFDRMFGCEPGEIASSTVATLTGGRPRLGELLPRNDRPAVGDPQPVTRHIAFHRRDGSDFVGEAVITSFALGSERVWLAVLQDVTERRKLEQEIIDVSNREQQRIGSDLHDGLGQELTGVALMLKSLATRTHRIQPDLAHDVSEAVELVNHAIKMARSLARGLSPVTLDRGGLVSALQDLVSRARETYAIDVSLHSRIQPRLTLDATTADHLYRIVQEALNNAVRHGGALHVRVNLTIMDRSVRLTISDDGIGFVEGSGAVNGMGLKIMAYRARMFGGQVTVTPRPQGGTRVLCTCLQPRAN